MAIDFGWRTGDVRESYWIDDPAFIGADGKSLVPQAARDAWQEDGDASHLEPYKRNGIPTRFTFRTLTTDETEYVRKFFFADGFEGGWGRACNAAFRIAVDLPDLPDEYVDSAGRKLRKTVKESFLRMLSDDVMRGLHAVSTGIVAFYGSLVLRAAFLTDAEKKASSQPSTPTPSAAGG